MSPSQDTNRCWLCDNAIWLFPIWTWSVACITGLLIIGLVRPPSMTAWLSLMALLVFPIAACVAVFIAEQEHDRSRDVQKLDGASPIPSEMRPVRRTR
jgi:hypothetical protein